MCLNIDIYKHLKYVENSKDEFTYEPVRTTKDITVYKLLKQEPNTGIVKTLYMNYPISFNKDGIYTYPKIDESLFSTYKLGLFYRMPCKGENSYHSFLDPYFALYRKLNFKSLEIGIYEATIPIGSLVWFGQDSDICSNQMIIHNKQNNNLREPIIKKND